jgi:hypothetical protein
MQNKPFKTRKIQRHHLQKTGTTKRQSSERRKIIAEIQFNITDTLVTTKNG